MMADFSDLNWGPVENVRHDLGVDVYLQVRDDRHFDRVALVTAQVKSGASYFNHVAKSESGDVTGWWYAEADAKHFEDWVQQVLPHLLVLNDPATRISYWAHVTKKAVTSTGDGFKILVPVIQRVDDANGRRCWRSPPRRRTRRRYKERLSGPVSTPWLPAGHYGTRCWLRAGTSKRSASI